MGYINVCDLCRKPIMQAYTDRALKVTVKRIHNRFDGLVPYRNTTTIEVCNDCTKKLLKATTKEEKES